jgi:hypothetical protein
MSSIFTSFGAPVDALGSIFGNNGVVGRSFGIVDKAFGAAGNVLDGVGKTASGLGDVLQYLPILIIAGLIISALYVVKK